MTKDQISGYTLRISNANRTEIIVILYDIFFTYIEEAKKALTDDKDVSGTKDSGYHKALRGAALVLRHLEDSLDFSYEVSSSLFPLYDFAERSLAKAGYSMREEDLLPAENIMMSLRDAFKQVASEDKSSPVMGNTEQVVAGYTYGRQDISETTANYDSSRGFLA